MASTVKLMIGSDVACSDGAAGKLRRLIVDPAGLAITHLDVEGRRGDGRLVPFGRVQSSDEVIHLDCTLEQFSRLEGDVDVQVVYDTSGVNRNDPVSLIRMPVFGQVLSGFGMGTLGLAGQLSTANAGPGYVSTPPIAVVPEGEVDLREGAYAIATDGEIGHFHGVIADAATGHLSHLLLGEGHVFARKEVAIPVESVTEVTAAGAHLSLSKAEVEALPAVLD